MSAPRENGPSLHPPKPPSTVLIILGPVVGGSARPFRSVAGFLDPPETLIEEVMNPGS